MIDSYTVFCAPLQGVTNHVWRLAHATIFGGIDAYFSPFMRIEHQQLLKRDINDVSPVNNQGINLIPQILACKPNDATTMALHLKDEGYSHININLGCPFPPIALRHKGSGMLPYPHEIEALFRALKPIPELSFSVKMRLGWQRPDEWQQVLPLFSIIEPKFIIVHPCIGKDQYKDSLNLEAFQEIVDSSSFPLIYNGCIHSIDNVMSIIHRWPSLHGVMIGRALASNPALLVPEKVTPDNYHKFYLEIYNHYAATLTGGDHQLLSTMHAFWDWFLLDANHKCRKAIKKATSIEKYENAVNELFNSL
ncbi:MAG: tRNA-dihydrouridine synthase family protein [Muribaculaceae bacterium]|nr:tRNA-dihydrouridine synthase family protein [Muribaculaceae bacterium]